MTLKLKMCIKEMKPLLPRFSVSHSSWEILDLDFQLKKQKGRKQWQRYLEEKINLLWCGLRGSFSFSPASPQKGLTSSPSKQFNFNCLDGTGGFCGPDLFVGETDSFVGEIYPLVGKTYPFVEEIYPFVGETDSLVGETHTSVGETDTFVGETHTFVGETHTFVGETHTFVGGNTHICWWNTCIWWWNTYICWWNTCIWWWNIFWWKRKNFSSSLFVRSTAAPRQTRPQMRSQWSFYRPNFWVTQRHLCLREGFQFLGSWRGLHLVG